MSTGVVLVESVSWRAGDAVPTNDGPDSNTETDPAPEADTEPDPVPEADPHHTVTEVDEAPPAADPTDFDAVHGATIAG
ncbi:MAG: hypothetical protein EOO74_10090, partial [Myxococcales bacterium]